MKSLRQEKNNRNYVAVVLRNYFHLKRVMAYLQHMCLCECDHPLQIKTILVHYNICTFLSIC